MKVIIGLAGEISSGKGSVAKYAKEKYNAKIYRFSDIFRNILDTLGLEHSRKNMSDLSLTLRKTFGEDVLDKALTEEIKKSESNVVVVDGVRRIDDIKYLKKMPKFILVFVETKIGNRYKRIVKRKENPDDQNKTFEEFRDDSQRNAELKISSLKKYADKIINNDGTLEELHKQIDNIFEK